MKALAYRVDSGYLWMRLIGVILKECDLLTLGL